MLKTILAAVALSTMTGLALYNAVGTTGDVEFVKDLDIKRFMGQWYVISSKPNLIEKNCKCSRSLDTLLDEKTIELAETCWIFGKKVTSKSKAIIEEPSTGHWTNVISFLKADYWVIDVDRANYDWAVIGQPNRKGYWVMSRTTTLDKSLVEALHSKAIGLGYDLSDIEYAEQSCNDTE